MLTLVGPLWLSEGRLLPETMRTAIGQQRVMSLPDGTVADLNVVTRVDYRMNSRQREVEHRARAARRGFRQPSWNSPEASGH